MKKLFFLVLVGLLALTLCACVGSDTPADTTVEDVTPAPTEPPTEAPTEAPAETPTEPPVTEPEEMTMEPKTTLSVIAEGKTDYTLVASADLQEKNAEDISYMTRVMDAKFGTHPTVAESASGKVISLAYTDGESLNWSLTVDEASGNIEIRAGGKAAMSRAIQTSSPSISPAPKGIFWWTWRVTTPTPTQPTRSTTAPSSPTRAGTRR